MTYSKEMRSRYHSQDSPLAVTLRVGEGVRGKGGNLEVLNRALKMPMETNKKIGSQQPSFGQILLSVVHLTVFPWSL